MSRYIDADKAKITYSSKDVDKVAELFNELLDAQPTADVRENVKGEWKEIAESGLCDLRRCSNCGYIEAVGLEIITPKPNYCPNCGAQMER